MTIINFREWLLQRNRWIPTLSLFPFLYAFGWLVVQPLVIFPFNIDKEYISLIGTIITFCLFIFLLPIWIKIRWSKIRPWNEIGLSKFSFSLSLFHFSRGFFIASMLILSLILILFLDSGLVFQKFFDIGILINSFLLCLVVGIAEELIFRGWLLGELINLTNPKLAIILESLIFSLVHIRTDMSELSLFALLLGLFILGLVLSFRRILDNGSLWGCIGLHGGLVGLWFYLTSGLVDVGADTSTWILGSGREMPNPIGGLMGIIMMVIILIIQVRAFAINRRPLSGALSASSNGAAP